MAALDKKRARDGRERVREVDGLDDFVTNRLWTQEESDRSSRENEEIITAERLRRMQEHDRARDERMAIRAGRDAQAGQRLVHRSEIRHECITDMPGGRGH